MFSFFNKEVALHSPVKGRMIPLEEVPDAVFAQKMLGEGAAFIFDGDTVYAPCDGEVIMVASTCHAIGIKAKNKAEIMIHVGLDTVNLNGKGFTVLVKSGEKVRQGQALLKLDQEVFRQENINMVTPMVVTSKDHKVQINFENEVDENSIVIKIR